jgi:DNA-directed RNA polymerase specialized sigma subunit
MEKGVLSDLVEKHLGLVDLVVAAEKRKLGIRDDALLEDLRSSAMVGLMAAVEKFDPSREWSFKAYAELRMKYAIYDGMADFGWFPRRLQRKIAFFRRASEMTYYQSGMPKPADSTEAVHRLSNQLKELATAYVTTYVEGTKASPSVPLEA